jgi:hypothetical protein
MNNTVYFKRQQQLTLRGHQGFSLFSYVDMVAHMLSFLCVCVCVRGGGWVCAHGRVFPSFCLLCLEFSMSFGSPFIFIGLPDTYDVIFRMIRWLIYCFLIRINECKLCKYLLVLYVLKRESKLFSFHDPDK